MTTEKQIREAKDKMPFASAGDCARGEAEEYLRTYEPVLRDCLQQALDMRWRPIESAPKDGTKVLVYRPIFVDRYITEIGIDWWDKWDGAPEGCWMKSRVDVQPTHWMPLPKPMEGGDV